VGGSGSAAPAKGRAVVALLLLVALVFRSAVPAGWMPNTQVFG
jgi:hypothetical protein